MIKILMYILTKDSRYIIVNIKISLNKLKLIINNYKDPCLSVPMKFMFYDFTSNKKIGNLPIRYWIKFKML